MFLLSFYTPVIYNMHLKISFDEWCDVKLICNKRKEDKDTMIQDIQRRKRIRIFTTAYIVAAVIALILLALYIVILLIANNMIQPEYTYYGNDDVSGWATILSGIGFLGGIVGKVLIGLIVIILLLLAVYWAIGLVLNHFLRKNAANGVPVRGVGTALGIWTLIPGAVFLIGLIEALMNPQAKRDSLAADGIFAALFICGSIFLLITLWRKERAV